MLKRTSTTALPKPGVKKGKLDLPSYFRAGPYVDISNKGLSDMHSNDIARAIKSDSAGV